MLVSGSAVKNGAVLKCPYQLIRPKTAIFRAFFGLINCIVHLPHVNFLSKLFWDSVLDVLNVDGFIMTIKTLICAAALALTAFSANALTVTSEGGSYDINSDALFTGDAVDLDGGAGSHSVTFYSLIDPMNGTVNASVTLNILGTFSDLTVSWVDSLTNTVLYTTAVVVGVTELNTTFTAPSLSQDLVFSWTDSAANVAFDFDVSAVPLPAGGLLLLTALGGLGVARRRKIAA